jgi:hypothetical protein
MRVANRLVSAVLALGVATTSVIVAVEIALAGLDRPAWLLPWHDWYRWTLEHSWTASASRLTLYGLCVAGLMLLLLAFAPQRPVVLDTEKTDPQITTRIRRRALEASLRRAAQEVDGVAAATVRVSTKQVRVRARSKRRDATGLSETITTTVAERLGTFQLARQPTVDVDVRPRSQ